MTAEQVRVVLVETSHPGNIGAAARALKNMGLRRLSLVAPAAFPHEEATARASGAEDLLERAEVFDTLADALASARWVVGASARPEMTGPALNKDDWVPPGMASTNF